MKYTLIAKCELCGASVIYEGDTKRGSEGGYITNIAQKAGLDLVEAIMMCSSCARKYEELQQRHKAEMTDFFMKGKEKT